MILDGGKFEAPVTIETEVCIVGSGAGGAVLGKELAEAGVDVVILEAGGHFGRADYGAESLPRAYRMLYRDGGTTASLGRPGIPIPLGRCIGGTTVVNSGTCFRTPAKILEKWRDSFGLDDISAASLAPYYERVEKILHVAPVSWHLLGKSAEIIARGAEKKGYSHRPLHRNVKECQGSGRCCFGCPTDAKQSMQISYIPRAVAAGARVYAHCEVERIETRGGSAWGVSGRLGRSATRPGVPIEVRARITAVCGGALLTPNLLRKSRKLEINRRELGRNLTIHPATKVLALMEEEVRCWEGVPQGYCIDHFAEEGMMFEGSSVPPEYGSAAIPFAGRAHLELMRHYDRLTSFGFLVSDRPIGRVRPGPGGRPFIRYDIGEVEMKGIVKGIEILCDLFLSVGARKCFAPVFGFETIRSAADIEAFKRHRLRPNELELAAFHPLGTCRMGSDPERSVVDGNLEVHGTRNLFVVDGSVFPSSLGVNPQMTIMAFATRTAERIARRLGRMHATEETESVEERLQG